MQTGTTVLATVWGEQIIATVTGTGGNGAIIFTRDKTGRKRWHHAQSVVVVGLD
jgi:hypothetical protein